MKKLEELKKELINNQIGKFYVFYGEDYGIRRHYIEKIKTNFSIIRYFDNCEAIARLTQGASLFKMKQLLLVHSDLNFINESKEFIETFIKRLDVYTVILIYESLPTTCNLYKYFENYITKFPNVQDDIAQEFVKSEVNLYKDDIVEIAKDCHNDYNNILLETDKIKQYAEANNMSLQNSYETLYNRKQMLIQDEPFNIQDFMNGILLR